MNKLALGFLTFISTVASASIECAPTQIQQWPLNPYILVTAESKSVFAVQIQRSYYGVIFEENFVSKNQSSGLDQVSLVSPENTLNLFLSASDGDGSFQGVLKSAEHGEQILNCVSK